MKYFLRLSILLSLVLPGTARSFDPADSAQAKKSPRHSNVRLITRIHSLGQFSYGGRIVSDNPVVDFNFTYDRKNWGFLVFKALDLRDSRTPINFTLAALNKNFHIGKRLTITPNVGVILEQSHSIADHGSDVTFILTTAYKVSKEVTVDYSALFGNMFLEPELKDWVNRFRFLYSKKHLDVTLSCWHNNNVLDQAAYVTYGGSIFYSRMKLAEGVKLNAGISGLMMPYTNDDLDYPAKNGILATLAIVLN